MWLVGVERMVGGFVFQALALHNGRLSAVQSIPVLELVFWLVIGVLWLRLGMSTAAWVSASVTSGGLAVFLVMSEPQGGHPQAMSSAWAPMIAVMRILVVVCTALPDGVAGAARRPLRQRIGNLSAVMVTFTKSTTDVLATDGPLAMLNHGAVYGVIAAGIAGTVLTQGRPAPRAPRRLPAADRDRQPLCQRHPRRVALRRTVHPGAVASDPRRGRIRGHGCRRRVLEPHRTLLRRPPADDDAPTR